MIAADSAGRKFFAIETDSFAASRLSTRSVHRVEARRAEIPVARVLAVLEIDAVLGSASLMSFFATIDAVADLLEWTLHPCVEVAREAGLLTERTTTLARLTKDFRNLIHPGRAARLAQKPDRSTALTAAAGVEAVIKELQSGHP